LRVTAAPISPVTNAAGRSEAAVPQGHARMSTWPTSAAGWARTRGPSKNRKNPIARMGFWVPGAAGQGRPRGRPCGPLKARRPRASARRPTFGFVEAPPGGRGFVEAPPGGRGFYETSLQTSSIRAMGALSPWRGPSLRMRV
jgi:hypothetical protein